MKPHPYLRPKAPKRKPGAQPELDQRCLQCRAGACKACVRPSCPCAEGGHAP